MSLPASLDITEALETAGQKLQDRTDRVAKTLQHLSPAFAILTDATGRAKGPESLALYAEYFAKQHLSPEAVYQAVRRIAIDWEKAYWPSPEFIANEAHRLLRDMQHETRESAAREREMEAVGRDRQGRAWEDRCARAEAWFESHPTESRALVAQVNRDIGAMRAARPDGWMSAVEKYRKAFREGSIVGGSLRYAAIGHTLGGQRELSELIAMRDEAQAVPAAQDAA